MSSRKLVNKIKSANSPCYITEIYNAKKALLYEDIFNQLANEKLIRKIDLDSSVFNFAEASPDLQLTDRSNVSKYGGNSLTDRRRNSPNSQKFTKEFILEAPQTSSTIKTRIKYASLERVGLKDLSIFYQYSRTVKQTKNMV